VPILRVFNPIGQRTESSRCRIAVLRPLHWRTPKGGMRVNG